MNFDEETYDNFNNNGINNLNNLNYNFSLDDRFIHVTNESNEHFTCQTPFLKILKPIHTTLNKKKTIAKKYIILETNDDLDFNNQIGEFMFVINKIHEISQEKIKEKSLVWFNTEFDDIGLDIKIRRPIDQQKDNEFIRISIPNNEKILNEINSLSKGTYVLCNIKFRGLKVSSDYIMEDWELINFITQGQYDELHNVNDDATIEMVIENNINENILNENENNINEKILVEDNLVEDNLVEDNLVEDNLVEDNLVEDNLVEDNLVEDNLVEDNLAKDNLVKDNLVKDNLVKDNLVKDNLVENTMNKINNIEDKEDKNQIKLIKYKKNILNKKKSKEEKPILIKKPTRKIVFTR
jgi:hypothetical protein